MKTRIVTAVLLAAIIIPARAQYLNLPDVSYNRFSITDRVWPAVYGEADVCLWEDDKVAAVSVAIDDNTLPNHDWWISMGDKYGFRFTWFVIVWPYMYDYDGSAGTNQGYYGTAASFKRLFDLGHDVQGHGTGTINSWSDSLYENDLLFTKRILEDSIPGNRCLAYAYPSGVATKSYVAARHFIGARGTTGSIDRANRVHVMNTYDASLGASSIDAILDPTSSSYRGWINDLSHLITTQTDSADKQAQLDAKEAQLLYLYERKADLWVAPFRKVISYNQSYATHTLTMGTVSASEIRFTVTDSMADSMFTYPLTVKVRLDADWDDMTVLQNGSTLDFSIILYEGNKYALVKAVPDGGEVVLTKTAAVTVAAPVVTPAGGTFRDSVVFSATCITSGAEIRYTLDGTDPDGSSTLYGGPVTLKASALVKVKGFKTGLTASATDRVYLTVVPDTDPPRIVLAAAVGLTTQVVVSFDEGVTTASAETPGNYAITGATVNAADLTDDAHTVLLTTSDLTPAAEYILTVSGVVDSSGNAVMDTMAFTMRAAAVDSGLQGYWTFDDGDGAAPDYSGHGNTALIYGAVSSSGIDGGALLFDGDAHVNLGPSKFDIPATNEFTVAFWFQSRDTWGGKLVDTRDYIRPYSIGTYYSGRKLDIDIRTSSNAGFTSTSVFDLDTWYHVALTYTDGEQVLYVNGAADVTRNQTGTLYTNSTVDDYVGAGFQGLIDEVRIYNRSLSATEIADLFGAVSVTEPVTADPAARPPVVLADLENRRLLVTGPDIRNVALHRLNGLPEVTINRQTPSGWRIDLPADLRGGLYLVLMESANGMIARKLVLVP